MRDVRSRSRQGLCRVRFAAVAAALAWAVGGSGVGWVRGEEKPAEMPPETVAKVTEVLKKAAELKRRQFDALMHDETASARKDANLDAEAVKGLEAAAAKAEEAAQEDFMARGLQAIRDDYAKNGAHSLEWLGKRNAASVAAGTGGPTGDSLRFTGPLDQPAWKDGIARTLTPEQIATWRKAQADREAALTKDIAVYLDTQTGPWHERAEESMRTPVHEIVTVLALPTERVDQINALAKQAVDASLEAWRRTVEKYFLKILAGKPPADRAKFLKGQGFFIDSMNADAPEKQAAWTGGLTKLLTDDDRARLQTARESHKTRRIHAFGQLAVAVLDEKIAFTASQRQRLEPILERLAQARSEFFPSAANASNYYSLQLTSFYKTAAEAKPEEMHPILDDLQWKHWQSPDPGGTEDNENEAAPRATPTPAGGEPSAGEPEDMEQAVSDYLQARAAARYRQVENVMVLQAEDATRVAGLEAPHAARLQTAARGAAEAAVAEWEPPVEQNTRAEVQGATPENIRQKLGNGMRYWYQRPDPQNNPLWKATVDAELAPPQRVAWTAERDARSRYGDAAVAEYLLAEFDRKFFLLPDQWDKLAPALTKALQDYQPDIRAAFSYNVSPWYLNSYYAFLPLLAVPENDFKALLSREQWDRWTGSQEYSLAANYWENIRQSHNQRVQQKEP